MNEAFIKSFEIAGDDAVGDILSREKKKSLRKL